MRKTGNFKGKVGFSAPADNILKTRDAENIGRTILTNSIIIRYQTFMNDHYRVIEKKFDTSEQMALIHVYSQFSKESGKKLWFFDNASHLPHFITVFREALEQGNVGELDVAQGRKLLEILERHLSPTEFLTLCDWICIQLTNVEKFSSHQTGNV